MKTGHLKTLLTLTMLPLAASTSLATDYLWDGTNWSPGAPPGAPNAVPAAGDRIILGAGGPAVAGQIIINPGAELQKTNGGDYGFAQHLDIAGNGVDGQGALKTIGANWIMPESVRITGTTSMRIDGGGYRHQNGVNTFNLNGQTLSVTGTSSWYFVNTNVQGTGTINVTDFGGEFNFEAGAVLPAGMTLNVTNARNSSWDGGGRVMAGNVNLNNGIIETRHNDNNKTYSGTIGLTNNGFFRTTWSGDGSSPERNDLLVTGQVTGTGTLVKEGNAVGVLHLTNGTNNYSGGTVINAGTISAEAAGAIPSGGAMTISPGTTLNINTFNQSIGSGTISGNVTGAAVLSKTTPGTLTINPAAALTNAGGLALAGGVTKTWAGFTNVTGPVTVTDNATLQPQQTVSTGNGLIQWERDNGPPNDAGAFQSGDFGTAGAIPTGITDGPVGIDTVGNHETFSWIYTGEIINTTAGTVGVSFAEQYDDNVKIKVDGNVVLNDGSWNTATTSALVNLAPGAHTVEFSSYEGGGGEGPNSGWDKGVGIRAGVYTLQDADGDGNGGATAGSTADNAAFLKINSANLASLGLTFGNVSVSNGASADAKSIAISAGKTLTVNTSDVGGGTYTMSGVISGSGGNLTKAGSGTLVLTGANTYTGITTVSQGVLKLGVGGSLSSATVINVAAGATFDGSAAGPVTVPASQTLSGNGTVIGNVVVLGHLAPGNSIGQLTVVGDLSLGGISDYELDRNGSPLTADLASVSGTLTLGGTLSLTNIGSPLQANDTFNLFDAGTTTGSFGTINWPAGTTAADWINNLGVNGTITFIPEAGTSTLTLFGGLLLLRRRRRR